MIKANSKKLLWLLGMLSLLLFGLGGCVGSTEDSSALGSSRLTIQINTSDPATNGSHRHAETSLQTRQAVDPGFITRLYVSVSAEDIPEPITAEVNDITENEITIELLVPTGDNRQITVTAFNGFGAIIFQGNATVNLTDQEQTVRLELQPEISANPAVRETIAAVSGGTLTVSDERTGIAGANWVQPM